MGWTDCHESFSLGTVLKGTSWGRPNDRIGAAGVVEGLSQQARAYFAAGGLGILIGDGQLNYRPERVFEAYYASTRFQKSLTCPGCSAARQLFSHGHRHACAARCTADPGPQRV
jgi:hypothetical protein